MTARRPVTLDMLPLYASDEQIGAALLGPARALEWPSIAAALERRGLPPVDPLHKGRYVPAVRRFYDLRHGVGHGTIGPADGEEHLERWAGSKRRV
jgi:hypothetical protein